MLFASLKLCYNIDDKLKKEIIKMSFEFVDIFRQPDSSAGATDASPFRFEERENGPCNDVKFTAFITETALGRNFHINFMLI